MSKHINLCILMAFFLHLNSIIGQVNIKVGYSGGFMKAPALNKIVDKFNTEFVNSFAGGILDDKFDQFRSVHGLEVGLRYRMKNVGFEISWNNMSDKSDVYATLPNSQRFQDKWFLSLTEYSAGIENYFGKIGYGASIGYRTVRMKTDIAGAPRKKRSVMEESAWSNRFYLIFQFPSQNVGISFKPYVVIPLKAYDVSPFDQEYNAQFDSNYKAVKPQEEKFFMYGISIVLYNGKQ